VALDDLEGFVHQKLTESPITGPLDRSSVMSMIIKKVKCWCVVCSHSASPSTLITCTQCYVSRDEKERTSSEWKAGQDTKSLVKWLGMPVCLLGRLRYTLCIVC